MSVFDKLKAYSRKPAAVILATVMATSTIPTTPIAQAVTAAYAEESQQSQPTKGETKTTAFDAKTVLSKNIKWDGVRNLELTFSTHINDGKATAKISADQVTALVNTELTKPSYDDQFQYTRDGQDALSKAIDAKLAEINKSGLPENKTETSKDGKEKTETKYSNAVFDDGNDAKMTREITGCKVKLANNTDGANSVAQVNDDGSISVETDNETTGVISLKVTQISAKVNFGYKYDKAVTKTVTSSSSDSNDSKDNTGGNFDISIGTEDGNQSGFSGTIGDNTNQSTTHETVTDRTDVSLNDVVSGYGVGATISTGQLSAKEYYDQFAPVADIDATDLIYKTPHDPYEISLGKQGLTGTVKIADADAKYFSAEPPTSSADLTQKIQITPKKAFDGEKTFTINWEYPNGDSAGSTTVHVKGIAKKPIDLSKYTGDAIDFRMAEDQNKELVKSLNKAVAEAVKASGTGDNIADYYESASISEAYYDTYYGNAESGSDLAYDNMSWVSKDDELLNNYDFKYSPTVSVKPMDVQDWTSGSEFTQKLSFKGAGLSGDKTITTKPKDDKSWTWIHEKAKVQWADGVVADASHGAISKGTVFEKAYTDPRELSLIADGSQPGDFYVKDDATGIVHKITNTVYKLDHTKPTLTAFNAVPEGATKIQKKGKTKDLSVLVAENMSVEFFASEGDQTSVSSGMNNVRAKYDEEGSRTTVDPQDITVSSTGKNESGGNKYEFPIHADSKVAVSSIGIDLTDNAGNKSKDLKYNSAATNIDVAELMSQTTAPTISTSWDTSAASHGKYYNTNRTLTVTINAPFFDYMQEYMPDLVMTSVTKDGASWQTLKPENFTRVSDSSDVWVATVEFTADGDYEVSNINVKDLLGRGAKVDGESFTIDKTAPKLNVSWNTEAAQNGKYYNAARTATITVEEHNFDPNLFKIEAPVSAGNGDEATPAQIGGWSSNGDTHTATVTFPGQGVYTLSVSGEDLASNKSESYTSPEFVIDTIKPKIDIQNVVNRTAYAGEVAPSAAVHDTNLADGTSIEVSKISYPLSKDDPNPYAGAAINTSATDKSVSCLNPAKTKGNDGVYTLTVQAIDLAGNTESEAVTWSVNRFGSTYVISDNTGKMLDQYLKSSKTTDVKVTEINPSGLDDNKTSVELTRDTKNTTLKSGDNYTTDSDTSSGWSEYNYTVSKSNYDKDGAYRVLFHSEDAAGNSSENTMEGKNAKKSGAAAEINFAVDDTAPIASFVDLASNGKYEESSHKAKVSFEDNLKLSKAQIKVNGKTVATFTADQLEKSPIREFTLDGSSSKQDVTVVAWDAAGNKSKELKATGVLVTNDSFVLWMNNLPLMVGTIVAIVVVAGGIYMVVAKKRKENEEK